MGEIQRVAGARVVDQIPRIGVLQPVIAGIVEAAPRQCRPQLAALAGVVVDNVQNDLEPGRMQPPHRSIRNSSEVVAFRHGVAQAHEERRAYYSPNSSTGLSQAATDPADGRGSAVARSRLRPCASGGQLPWGVRGRRRFRVRAGACLIQSCVRPFRVGLVDHGIRIEGVRGLRSAPQEKWSSVTTDLGIAGALSRRSIVRSVRPAPIRYPNNALVQCSWPEILLP